MFITSEYEEMPLLPRTLPAPASPPPCPSRRVTHSALTDVTITLPVGATGVKTIASETEGELH